MKLYDDNPTLPNKEQMPEDKQGEVFFREQTLGNATPHAKKFYIESYGCAMNFSDSEIVASILADVGYSPTKNIEESSLILINTCSIREKAEETVRKRLTDFAKYKRANKSLLIGVLGCMAERLKARFLNEERLVDLVVGPDAYRDLPNLVSTAEDGSKGVNVLLSREETYSEITPVRLNSNGIMAFVSIMRGCDNMCSFCVVPFTRGRERSRDAFSVLAEAQNLFDEGYREVTLLGQNVDSYKWESPDSLQKVNFAKLLEMVAQINPLLRVRFSTSHPKDITDEVLHTMAKYNNICKYIHLPVQSGNSRVLSLMNRTYDRAWYMERVASIRRILPDCSISSDIISGFCTETEADHQETLSIIEEADFYMSYMYFYSERPGTLAAKKLEDDVPLDVKKRRLAEIVEVQRLVSLAHNLRDIGKTFEVLVERESTKSVEDWCGRNSQGKMIVFAKNGNVKPGDYVQVYVHNANKATLLGELV
jgi:tRNA-2-methylthio-N6-dimethylallyladenosine synthase